MRQGMKYGKKRKKKNPFKIILLLLFLVILFGGVWFFYQTNKNGGGLSGAIATVIGQDEKSVKELDKLNILILGESGGPDGYKLADSIMVASYDPKNQKASLLSIPRDTYVGSKNKNTATQNYLASYKINSVYRNGSHIDEALSCVNNVLDLDLKYYAIINTEALIELVDAIGGITFTVPIDMDYDDPTQNLHIHLKAGEQIIDGKKAEQLLRFRHNNDGTTYPASYGIQDFGRMRTQREFIMATLKQTVRPENSLKILQILNIITKNVKTNLNLNDLKDYIPSAIKFNTQDLVTDVLPGKAELCNKVWIYAHDEEKSKEIVDRLFKDKIPEATQGEEIDTKKSDEKTDVTTKK